MAFNAAWEPPQVVSFDEVLKLNEEVTARAGTPIDISEDIFRIHELAMDWDIGVVRYAPKDISRIPTGPDGKKVGILLAAWRRVRFQIGATNRQAVTGEVRHPGGVHDLSRPFLLP